MYFYLIIGLKTAIVEKEAINKGYKLKIGNTALGKAKLSTDGFIKDDNGCNMIGYEIARKLETTSFEFLHPHN